MKLTKLQHATTVTLHLSKEQWNQLEKIKQGWGKMQNGEMAKEEFLLQTWTFTQGGLNNLEELTKERNYNVGMGSAERMV